MTESTLLEIIRKCHNHNPWSNPTYHPFLLNGIQIGFLLPSVFAQLSKSNHIKNGSILSITHNDKPGFDLSPCETIEKRSKVLSEIVSNWKEENIFPDPLNGWRNELYDIFEKNGILAFKLERSACSLFGFLTFGVHLTAFTPDMKIWVPRRSKTKSTWPGYLDNSVAGGITAGDKPMESMIRECGEEAGLSEDLVKKHILNTGVISYFYQTKSGCIQPEIEFTYDLPLPSKEIILTPIDGEAESFQLLDWKEVLKSIKRDEFKPNCSLVLIDFFIRHSLLKVEDEKDYLEISTELRNKLGLPGPSYL